MTENGIDLGWWQWIEGEGGVGRLGAMCHVYTGEKIVHRGTLSEAVPDRRHDIEPHLHENLRNADGLLQRFDYLHNELEYPLVVAVTPDFSELHVDHNASVVLWRLERGGAQEYPPYGVFCRVDDALLEAFRIWPSSRSASDRPGRLSVLGGWFNGSWLARLLMSAITFPPNVFQHAFALQTIVPDRKISVCPLDAKTRTWLVAEKSDQQIISHNILSELESRSRSGFFLIAQSRDYSTSLRIAPTELLSCGGTLRVVDVI